MRTIQSRRWLGFVLGILAGPIITSPAYPEKVVPVERVTTGVNVRQTASSSSPAVGVLRPGEQADYIRSVPRWHKIRLENGQEGFVSKSWTDVIPDPLNVSAGSSFIVHFLDVGTGDSAIIDMGNREIIIDGGDSVRVLNAYAKRTGLIDGPIELVIVTHGDSDHWKGLTRLLGFDGVEDDTPAVLEYWDPGYNRDCNSASNTGRRRYLDFVQNIQSMVPAANFRRPLERHFVPGVDSGQVQPFTISSVPGVTFTLLHSDATPTTGSCSYKINNASIVLLAEIDGVRFLFTGDANGKRRDESSPGTPAHVEQKLLTLERDHPGTLKADVLKVPHHGSETASTQAFIDAADPGFAIISASTRHHLPKDTVVDRYRNGQRVILRTDDNQENDRDHILCTKRNGALDCNFADAFTE